MGGLRWIHAFVLCLLPGCDCGGSPAGGLEDGPVGDAASPDGDVVERPDGSAGDAEAPDAYDPIVRVWINEVVVYPAHDWSDSLGTPYDAAPGAGAITSVDQLIELRNDGDPVDLTGWRLEMIDGDPTTTTLDGTAVLAFEAGSSLTSFQPGALAVIGDPAGRASTDVYLVLRDAAGRIIDEVEIGGLSAGRDYEGDGAGDGAPDPGSNGFARGAFDEAVARPVGALDSDDDQADFVQQRATPLAPNLAFVPPVDRDPPQIVSRASRAPLRVSEAIWIELDEPVDPASVDDNLVISVGGAPVPLGFFTFADDDRTIVINPLGVLPFGADVDVTLQGGAGGVTDLAGNPLPTSDAFTVHTEGGPASPGMVVINEVCSDPMQDWDDDEGGDGVPFSATPGTAPAAPDDEWIELLKVSAGTSDLSGWTIGLYRGPSLIDDARAATSLSSTQSVISLFGIGIGIGDVQTGDRVVVGNPSSSMPPDFWLELRDDNGALVDVVEIGGNSDATDRGGDGVDNGAPGVGEDGSGTDLSSECVVRVPDGADTGGDLLDFEHGTATLGAGN